MRYVTPTGLAKAGGTPVERLGSLRAVLRAMEFNGVVIFANPSNGMRLFPALQAELMETGLVQGAIVPLYASAGPNALYELPRETVIGVDDDAFTGVSSAMWADMHKILTTRFPRVYWA